MSLIIVPSRTRRSLARWALGPALVAALLATLPVAVGAQEGGLPSIGVVDAGLVFQQSQYGKDLLGSLKQLREQKQAEGQAKKQDAEALRDRIAQSRLALSPEKLEELEKELEDKVIALQRFEADAKRAIDEASADAMTSFNEQIMPVIDAVGRERGLTLIFNKFEAGLLFADEKLDITDSVIELFDQRSGPAAAASEPSE